MIVTFKSPAAGDVIMFGDNAKQMMKLMGKSPDDKGIVTVEQLPDAIAGLRAAIDADKAARQRAASTDESDDPERRGMGANVSVAQRAVPLLELLEWAQRKGKPVTWGV